MKIAVTGATGFIGNELVNFFSENHHVLALQRKRSDAQANIEYRYFDLTDESTYNAVEGAEALVHCAFIQFNKSNPDAFRQNVEGTLRLAELCRQKNIHFIFLSTMSAHENALSQYGKHKFEIEQRLGATNCAILKLGLVIGSSGGLFNNIRQTILKSSLIPLVDGGTQPIQIIHIADLSKIILKIAQQRISGIYNIGTPQVYTLKYLYETIANSQQKKIKFVSLPFGFMKLMLTVAESLGLRLPVNTENLLGLKQLQAFETKDDLQKLGVELMSLEQAVKLS